MAPHMAWIIHHLRHGAARFAPQSRGAIDQGENGEVSVLDAIVGICLKLYNASIFAGSCIPHKM